MREPAKNSSHHRRGKSCLRWAICLCLQLLAGYSQTEASSAAPQDLFEGVSKEYSRQTHGMLKKFCMECHSTAAPEGELDLERFSDLSQVRQHPAVWIKVLEMIDNGEMPPKDAEQPSADERRSLRDWVRRYLDAEALASAGDPGRSCCGGSAMPSTHTQFRI